MLRLAILLFFLSIPSHALCMESQAFDHSKQKEWQELLPEHSLFSHLVQALKLSIGINEEEKFEPIKTPIESNDSDELKSMRALKNLMINNTGKAVESINDNCDEFASLANSIDFANYPKGQKKLVELMNKFSIEKPLPLLSECAQISDGYSSWTCDFSRVEYPHIRNSFDTQVITHLRKLIESKNEIHYVEFASGSGTSSLILLTKLFDTTQAKAVTIHLVDLMHGHWSKLNDLKKQSHEVRADKENIAQNCTNVDADTMQSADMSEKIAMQHLNWYAKLYPAAAVKIFLHGNMTMYLKHQSLYKMPPADITIACDIQDKECVQNKALDAYMHLCYETLGDKKESEHFLLSINSSKTIYDISKFKFDSTEKLLSQSTLVSIKK